MAISLQFYPLGPFYYVQPHGLSVRGGQRFAQSFPFGALMMHVVSTHEILLHNERERILQGTPLLQGYFRASQSIRNLRYRHGLTFFFLTLKAAVKIPRVLSASRNSQTGSSPDLACLRSQCTIPLVDFSSSMTASPPFNHY